MKRSVARSSRALPGIALACALLASLLPSARGAHAQPTNPEAERYFRVEWEPVLRGGGALEGYVYSTYDYRVGGVRLRVDILDSAGQIEGQALGWVQGDIPAHSRAYFLVSLPRMGAGYRVTVVSFYRISHGLP
jgi:hypothetical protein